MSSILSSVEGGVIGVGVGTAAAAAITPTIEPAKQDVWHANPYRVLDPRLLAELVVQALTPFAAAQDQAQRSGYDGNKFRAMVEAAFKGPPVAEALELWRRDKITPDQMRHALHKGGIETQYVEPIMELFVGRLDPRIIATAIQRGIMLDPGFLPVGPPTGVGKVPKFPVSALNTLDEAKAHGMDYERLFVETAIVGLPASPDLAARMTFRNIINRIDFDRAISEGNTRNEWADFLFEGFREIPSVTTFVEGRLRAWINDTEMYEGTARHGMSKTDTDLLFKTHGRPISFHQVFIGERRGGTYGEDNSGIEPAFLKSLQESNIRPEWYQLAWAQRHALPSAFVLRGLATRGDIDPATTRRILMWLGWPEFLVDPVVSAWTGSTTGVDAATVKSARTQAISEIRSAFLLGQADEGQATGWLKAVGVTPQTVGPLLAVWRVMLEVPQKGLTADQIVKAFKNLPAQWPRSRALDELQQLGLTADDAATLLDE